MLSGTVYGDGSVVVTHWVPSVVLLGGEGLGAFTVPVSAVEPMGTLPVEWPSEPYWGDSVNPTDLL